jgi:hypothetical protein
VVAVEVFILKESGSGLVFKDGILWCLFLFSFFYFLREFFFELKKVFENGDFLKCK